jgi:histidine ammonia-lyase
LHQIRPHRGQLVISDEIRTWLKDSPMQQVKRSYVQDPYSFRCIPQVHGAVYDTVLHVKHVVETEINSVTDNPTIFSDAGLVLSGGNFHGQPLAMTSDFLAVALAELGSIAERRTYKLISGTRGLPAFLTENPGLNSGLMIPQYTAASIVSRNKQLCMPCSVDTIDSSNGQEDHVSMGANAVVRTWDLLQNVQSVLAIELITAAQALDLRRPERSSEQIEKFVLDFRKHVVHLQEDRELWQDIQAATQFVVSRLCAANQT